MINNTGNYLQGREKRGKNERRKEGQKGNYINGIIHKGKEDLMTKDKKNKKAIQTDRQKQAKHL
jgi:hypothetical protein